MDIISELSHFLGHNFTVELERYPGEGAEKFISQLRYRRDLELVVVVWFLNELFKLGLAREYPESLDDAARRLGQLLLPFAGALVILGGTSTLWGVHERCDQWVRRIRRILERLGIIVINVQDCASHPACLSKQH